MYIKWTMKWTKFLKIIFIFFYSEIFLHFFSIFFLFSDFCPFIFAHYLPIFLYSFVMEFFSFLEFPRFSSSFIKCYAEIRELELELFIFFKEKFTLTQAGFDPPTSGLRAKRVTNYTTETCVKDGLIVNISLFLEEHHLNIFQAHLMYLGENIYKTSTFVLLSNVNGKSFLCFTNNSPHSTVSIL